jgi:hypothetical protein
MVKHTQTHIGFHFDARAKEANAPGKSSGNHCQNDKHHRLADVVEHKVEIEGEHFAADFHKAGVNAVDEVAVELGNLQLGVVNRNEREDA